MVIQNRNAIKTSDVNLNHVFPSCGLDWHLRYSSRVSISLKVSSSWLPTSFTRWRVCTMLVFTWKCLVDLQKHWKCYHHDLSIHMMTKWDHLKVWSINSLVDVMHDIQKEAPLASCIQANVVHYIVPLSVIIMKPLNVACPCLELVVSIAYKEHTITKDLRWGFSANLASNSLLTEVQWGPQLEVSSSLTDRSSLCSLQMET